MSATQHGETLLMRISNEIVKAQKQHWGKGPTQAKSYMLDDFLIVVMRGGLTVAEQTMLDFGHHDRVRDMRQHFENEMAGRLRGIIEELTGRRVVQYQSQVMFDPDTIVEMFFFEEPAPGEGVQATVDQAAGGDPAPSDGAA